MVTLGYCLAILMGMTLGLIGAGGAILTMPILVYCMKIPPLLASSHSLFIVTIASLTGAMFYWRQRLVQWQTILLFAPSSVLSVLFARLWILPAIPDPVGPFSKNMALMLFFAALMWIAAVFMLRPFKGKEEAQPLTLSRGILLVLASAGVGTLTGIIGIGGGFLIIPTLVCLFGLPMKQAVGTSLTLTAINAFMGFQGDFSHGVSLNWTLLYLFSGMSLMGMFSGMFLGRSLPGESLKKGFGVFVLLISMGIISREMLTFFDIIS